MRKVNPDDVRADFITFVAERLSYLDRVDTLLRGTTHEKRDVSLLSETTLHAVYVAFECFLSDLLLAYLNRDFTQYQTLLRNKINSSVQSKVGAWAASHTVFTPVKHIKLDELELIVDPDSYNLTFKTVAQLKQRATDWLVLGHRNGFLTLPPADERLIDTVHCIRNFIAHQSKNSKDKMNESLQNLVVGPACPNQNLAWGGNEVRDAGAFLKSKVGGQRRVIRFAQRLAAIAATL